MNTRENSRGNRLAGGVQPACRSIFACILAAVAVGCFLIPTVSAAPTTLGGFNGIKWGSGAGESSGLTLLAQDGDLKFYKRDSDSLKMDDVALESLVYGFSKDRFYNVTIHYSTRPAMFRLKDAISKEYGIPYQPDGTRDKYYWSANSVDVLLIFDDASGEGRVSYLYQPITKEIEQD